METPKSKQYETNNNTGMLLIKKNKELQKVEQHNSMDLQSSVQMFNPSSSPPINNFMDRLCARNLIYGSK